MPWPKRTSLPRCSVFLTVALWLGAASVLHSSDASAQRVRFDADGETEMLARINMMRAAEELPPLARDSGLDDAARAHSRDMAEHQELTHVSEANGKPGRSRS